MNLNAPAVNRVEGLNAQTILNRYLATTPQMVSDFTAPQEALDATKVPVQTPTHD